MEALLKYYKYYKHYQNISTVEILHFITDIHNDSPMGRRDVEYGLLIGCNSLMDFCFIFFTNFVIVVIIFYIFVKQYNY